MPNKWVIRTTDRGRFKRCRQQWDFESPLRANYEPIVGANALDLGTAFHYGQQVRHTPGLPGGKPAEARAVAAFHAKVDEQWNAVPKVMRTRELKEEYAERRALGEGMLRQASSHDLGFTPVAVELDFEIPIMLDESMLDIVPRNSNWKVEYTEDPKPGYKLFYYPWQVFYAGRIDCVAKDPNGNLWIVDWKTTASFKSIEWLTIDTQVSSYCWAAHEMEIPVLGFIYFEFRKAVPHKPKVLKGGRLSKDKRQLTTYDLYIQAIRELGLDEADYGDILEYLRDSGEKYIRRIQEHRSSRQLRRQQELIVMEAIDMLDNPSIYPNPSAFNCNNCKFYDPCLAIQDGRRSELNYILNDSGLYRQSGAT